MASLELSYLCPEPGIRGFPRSTRFAWPLRQMSEVVELHYGKALTEENRVSGNVPVYGTNGVTGSHDEALSEGPTVVLGRKGMGHLGVEWCSGPFWVIDTAYFTTFDRNILEPRFFYYFTSYVGLNHLKHGTSNPSLTREIFSKQYIPLPSIEEQRRIVDVLQVLDDKVESNRRSNQTLEALARAIFKAWFIDFEPVKAKAEGATSFRGMPQEVFESLPSIFADSEMGWIPEGWGVSTVSDLAEYVNGKAFTKHANGKGRMIIRIAELNSGPGPSTKYADIEADSRHIAFPGDILFAWSGSLGVHRWYRSESIVNQHIFKVIPRGWPSWFVFFHLVEAMPFFKEIASTKATTMGHIKRGHLSEAQFAQPPRGMLEAGKVLIGSMFEAIRSRELESIALANLRDELVPRLIRGELRMPEGADGGC